MQCLQQLIGFQHRLMVEMLKHYVFERADLLNPVLKHIIIKKLAHLKAYLGKFIRIKRSYS